MKIVFFGSGPFGLPALERVQSRCPPHEVVRVVTRPDRPQKRGQRTAPTPVRERARELGLSCDAPESANDPAYLDTLESIGADLFLVADYGEILRRRLRELPRIGVFNLHASILPAYRGAAPVARALLGGEAETGVTLFRIEKGLDSGPIVDAVRTAIAPLETAGELEARLAQLAADLVERNLEAFASGTFREEPQDEARATLAPKLEKRAGAVPWERSAVEVTNLVRALNPWPGAFSFLHPAGDRAARPERTVFLRVKPAVEQGGEALSPGTVENVRREVFTVRCGEGAVEVLELQREGRAALDAAAYLRGRPLARGDRFATAAEAA